MVAYLFWSADVSATIGRDDVANRVSGNRHPLAVHSDFIMVANHATLGRAAIPQAAARTLAVISSERRKEVPMPFIVADPVMPFLRACACTKESRERAKKSRRTRDTSRSPKRVGRSRANIRARGQRTRRLVERGLKK